MNEPKQNTKVRTTETGFSGPAANRPRARRRLGRHFFERPALQVARDLIGKYIVRRYRGRLISAMITETEAYKGPEDRASRAFGGRRTRSVEALYHRGGAVYVYMVYGMHWLLNFKAAPPDKPQAVLIRAVLPATGSNEKVIDGPAKVSRFLRVDGSLNGDDVMTSKNLWIEDRGIRISARQIERGPRIGIDYAGPYWAARPWRFSVDIRAMLETSSKKS